MKTKRSYESAPVAYTFTSYVNMSSFLRAGRKDAAMSRTEGMTLHVWSDAKGHARLAFAAALAEW